MEKYQIDLKKSFICGENIFKVFLMFLPYNFFRKKHYIYLGKKCVCAFGGGGVRGGVKPDYGEN